MLGPREVYRDKRGRFVPKWKVWQGPPEPNPLNSPGTVAKWRAALAEDATRASQWLRFIGR